MTKKDEELPSPNPAKVCPRCKRELPMWKLHRFLGEIYLKVISNFPMGSTICIDCQREENELQKARPPGWGQV